MYHLKIMFRNLRRGGIYSVVNVGGLAIGMTIAILIFAWIHHEWSYDRFHTKEKNLYVVYSRATSNGVIRCWDMTPNMLGTTLKSDYPEIRGMAKMTNRQFLYAHEDAKFKINTGLTEPDFLTMFDFPLLQGNSQIALNDPYSVILTEKAAIRLFGEEDALGQTLLVDGQYPVTVTGVMKDLPGNTLFGFEALIPMDYLKAMGQYNEDWGNFTLNTYVELHPDAKLDLVNESVRNIIKEHRNNSETEVFLYPLSRRHLYSNFVNGMPAGGMINGLRIIGLIPVLILLIACINYTNLNTARSEKRAKEVGVRKVMGGKRSSLIKMFLGESLMVSCIAGAVALILAYMILPVFETLMGKKLVLDLTDFRFWLTGLGFVVFTGVLAGSYPAFYLSSFLPVKTLKGLVRKKQSSISSRKVLVVLQFTVATALIISTLVIHRQIKHAQNREPGYDKEQLIYIAFEGDVEKNYEQIKHNLLTSGTAISVTKTFSPMVAGSGVTWNVEWQGKDPSARILFNLFFVDADWTQTVGTTIIEGRDIDVYTYPTDSTAMLLNEAAVKTMNFENPIGKIITTQGKNWCVVGVVKDFILNAPSQPIAPLLIGGPSGWLAVMHIKLNGNNRMTDNLARVEQTFRQFNPDYPFEYQFVDEAYTYKFKEEQLMGSFAAWFAGLTIFISCMGLFALVAYMAETRRKEIGIRKVLGASVADIMMLLSKEFLRLVLISVTIASPIAWLAMNQWLTGYAYRTNIPWWMFIVVGCLSLGIALLTVGFQAFKAATANPVDAIKNN